jgi:hypothetical protein
MIKIRIITLISLLEALTLSREVIKALFKNLLIPLITTPHSHLAKYSTMIHVKIVELEKDFLIV